MNGRRSFNAFSRREFIQLCSFLFAAPLLNACNFGKRDIPVRILGANHKTGHLLRENKFPKASQTIETSTLIIGGGISGLSAARYLKKNKYNDFLLLEMDATFGGNSRGGKNIISVYPLGAHYLPVPNISFKELIDFLHEHNIITGFDASGLPIYNEYYLGFEPLERLYYRGVWVDGLPPKEQMNKAEEEELDRFIKITEDFKNKVGSDGKPAFTIPLENSSSDPEFLELDKISMEQFLNKNGFNSEFLHWYINYCCKDDFGTQSKNTSAWAGIHYFSARRAKASNAGSGELLTWPEGNNFLVNCLAKELKDHLKQDSLAYNISREGEIYHCLVFNVANNESILYKCKNLVMATPQYVNKHLLGNIDGIQWEKFGYYPWLVANISIKDRSSLNGTGTLSWDNVIHNSNSLGYVNACHQKLNMHESSTVLTYYYNFSEQPSIQERKKMYEKSNDEWRSFIINDLKLAHPNIEDQVENIDIQLWGHGMISPSVGFRNSASRIVMQSGINNMHFVNSDVSGISIFEQAFYRGTLAAQRILQAYNE